MKKRFEIKDKSIYAAPIKILENYIFPELERKYGMRVQATGYKFICSAGSDGASKAAPSSVDFHMTDVNGDTDGYTLRVISSIIENATTDSEQIATAQNLSSKAINKYKLVFVRLYCDDEITVSASDFVVYAIDKFYGNEGKNHD